MTIPFQATVLLTYKDGHVEERVFPIESIRNNFVFVNGGEEFGEEYGPFCIAPEDSPEHQEGAFQCQPAPSGERLSPQTVLDCRTWQEMTCAPTEPAPSPPEASQEPQEWSPFTRGPVPITEEDAKYLRGTPKPLITTIKVDIEKDPE